MTQKQAHDIAEFGNAYLDNLESERDRLLSERNRLREINAELVAALNDIVTQFPFVYGVPVPAWIRNGQVVLARAKGEK